MPPKKQLPKNAGYTTVGLSHEDYEAIHEVQKSRKAKSNQKRTSMNSILVDALWELLIKETGKNRDQIRAALPESLRTPEEQPKLNKITEMRKTKAMRRPNE